MGALYRARGGRGAITPISEAAQVLKQCYLPLALALDLATPASTRVAPSGISVDGAQDFKPLCKWARGLTRRSC